MFYLLDENLNFMSPIESYQSAIWTTRYYKPGDFELYLPATTEILNLIKRDCYLVRDDDFTQAMIIENIQITTSIEDGNFLTITGKCLKSILDRRIILKQTTVNGNVEKCIRRLITENAITPTMSARKIDNLILGAELGITDTMNSQYTGDNLGEVVSKICINYGLGYDILLDLDKKQFIFILFKGSDRSYNQNKNPFIVFSNEFDNLLSTNYINNNENYKNVAIVAGEGEGLDRKIFTVGTATGLKRYELFVDSRDSSTKEDEPITEDEYNAILAEKGKEALTETIITESIEGELEPHYTYQFNRDYFLGDIVEVVNEYGLTMQPQITEVIESEDDNGKNVVVTFETKIEKEV